MLWAIQNGAIIYLICHRVATLFFPSEKANPWQQQIGSLWACKWMWVFSSDIHIFLRNCENKSTSKNPSRTLWSHGEYPVWSARITGWKRQWKIIVGQIGLRKTWLKWVKPLWKPTYPSNLYLHRLFLLLLLDSELCVINGSNSVS